MSLKKQWLLNTVGVVALLTLVCVLAVTAVFAVFYAASLERDLRFRARTTVDLLQDYSHRDSDALFLACVNYAQSFSDRSGVELQFLDENGVVYASSDETLAGQTAQTPDVDEAAQSDAAVSYYGRDLLTNRQVVAVSTPLRDSEGALVGVLRFTAPTASAARQIMTVGLLCAAVGLIVVLVVLASGVFFLQSLLAPLAEITEKARRIANGSYGVQIQPKYDGEIGELADTINELSAKISQNEKMQAEFISSLSHELRTPLTAITGWSETLLGDESLEADTRRGMTIIRREAQRLTEMVVELLDFTRMQDGRMTLNMEQADIRAEFEDTVYMYSTRLAQDGITLEYEDSDEDIPEILCDSKRMRQVFLNILDNAAKHGGEGKRIDASVHPERGQIVFRIRDYGPGIPEDELSLVKKKFYKGSSKARGTGIGLAVCDEIVQLHNGTLTLANAEDGGTVVTVSIPANQ